MAKKDNQVRLGKKRILVVDDHSLIRHGLTAMLAGEPDLEVCGEATTAPEALSRVRALRPDLAVIDISLPQGHGLDLVKQIRSQDDRIKLLVLSMYDEALYAERALRAGASGYLNKEEAIDKVTVAIRHIRAHDKDCNSR